MPVYLRPNELFVKNPNGAGYLPQNVISQTSTAEMLEAFDQTVANTQESLNTMTSAAQQAVDGIEAQKNTMIASIASVAGQGTDTTLTQSGVAADAKIVGDEVSKLDSASDILNAQSSIISGDIYGFAPVTEQKSIRGITINGSGKLLEVNGTATSGVMISLTGSKIRAINSSSPSEAMLADTIPVIAGHKYRLSANVVRGNWSGQILYTAYDVSGNSMGSSQLGCGIDFIPADDEIGCAVIFIYRLASVDNALIEFHLTDITNGVNWEPVNFEFYEGYLNSDGSIVAPSASRKEKYTNRIKTKPGELFEIKYTVGSDGGWAAYVCYDQSGTIIGGRQTLAAAAAYTKYDGIFTIPADCYEIAFCFRSYGLLGIFSAWRNININDMYVDVINIKDDIINIQDDIVAIQNSGTHVANAFDIYGIKSINHAGYGTLANGYPDNTIPVFLLSKQHGFSIVETDLRLTSDGVPVLLHDASINRTARNADGSAIEGTVNIASITYEQALQYDFGIAAGAKWAGTKIPSLAEFLRMCMENDLLAYVEIEHTDAMTPAKIAEIIEMTRDAGMLRRVTWIGMNPVDLRNVLLADNAARVGWVLNEQITSTHEATYKSLITSYNEAFIDCRHGYFSPAGSLTEEEIEAEVALLKSWGCALEVWTPDQAQQIRNVHNYCTGYTSNYYNANIVLRKAVQDTLYLESPNGTIYKVTVTDEGTLSVAT